MKKIIFDLMNNDDGQLEAIMGANLFLRVNPDYFLVLIGDKNTIENNIEKEFLSRIEIIHNANIAHKVISPRDALRGNNSMLEAFNALENKNGLGIVSSGDSGSFLTLATLKIKRLPNVARPAFMPIMPTTINDKNILLLDAGANLEVKPEYLLEWATLASYYYKILFNNNKIPQIGFLNVGTEDYKGNSISKEANLLLRESKNEMYKYSGFVEPVSAINGQIDILLADGYAGNIFLKTMENTFLGVGKLLKKMIMKNCITKLGGLFLKKELKKFKQRFDYRNVGGAFIVGLSKIVVKAHGSSDRIAFFNSLNQIKLAIEANLIAKLEEKLQQE